MIRTLENTSNLNAVILVAEALGEMVGEVIFVGGSILDLYATEPGAELARPTIDVDISVQVSTYHEMDMFRERLAKKQIFPSSEGGVLYRFAYQNTLIDVIPFEDTLLGPTNRWIKPGFRNPMVIKGESLQINILTPPLFLATKWEAFNNRGKDPRMSSDFEDIIYVLDNNRELLDHLKNTDPEVIHFLKSMAKWILSHPFKKEIIECHLNPLIASDRSALVISKLEKLMY